MWQIIDQTGNVKLHTDKMKTMRNQRKTEYITESLYLHQIIIFDKDNQDLKKNGKNSQIILYVIL